MYIFMLISPKMNTLTKLWQGFNIGEDNVVENQLWPPATPDNYPDNRYYGDNYASACADNQVNDCQ